MEIWRIRNHQISDRNAAMFKNPASTDDNNVFTYDGISRKNLKEFLTNYRDFEDYKEGDDTSDFIHKNLN